MVSRGKDQFYFVLTSDGGVKDVDDNKTSNFKIPLSDPIDFGEERWEVGLKTISYDMDWTNIGRSAGVFMEYYTSPERGLEEVVPPDWLCQSMKELEDTLAGEIVENAKRMNVAPQLTLKIDALGRVKIGCDEPFYDIGFSDNMLGVLGLLGHEHMDYFRLDSFRQRQRYRDIIDTVTKKPFNYKDFGLVEQIVKCKSVEVFLGLILGYLDLDELATTSEGLAKKFISNNESMVYHLETIDISDGVNRNDKLVGSLRSVLCMLMYSMHQILKGYKLPNKFKGIIPGVLNPVQRMFIYLNVLENIHFNNTSSKLLKIINTRGAFFKTTQEEFVNPTYLPVQRGKHNLFHVYIKNDRGENVPFQSGTVVLILHFRRSVSSSRDNPYW